MNKDSKVNFYYTFLLLDLVISLIVKSNRKHFINTQNVAQKELELECEY